MRKEFCELHGIEITYSDDDIAFEDTSTAMSILIANDGTIIHNNFEDDPEKTKHFLDEFHRIYKTVTYFRSLDRLEEEAG